MARRCGGIWRSDLRLARGRPARRAAARRKRAQGNDLALDWPVSRRPGAGGVRRAGRAQSLLLRQRGRRGVEVHQRRLDVGAAVRQAAGLLDREYRGGRVRPERDLRRHRRSLHPQQHFLRQRRLQVQRWRQDLEASWARRHAPHRPHPGASAEPGDRPRGRAGPRLRAEPRARHLPLHRWRQDVGKGPLQGRANPHVLFAALWEASRSPWGLTSGGPGSGLYRSGDGGATWKRLEANGLPKGLLGRIGVSVSATNSNRVYALIEAEEGGLYRSDDGGEKWSRVNDDHRFRQRAWYYTHVIADPTNPDTVYVLNTGTYRSTDGGQKFTLLMVPHGDHHALWIDPANSRRMINGNDGGATISVDGGESWTRQDNQATAQFYHVITDNRFPYYVYGAQQDNSTVATASMSDSGWIDRSDWYSVGGGESGYIAPDPRDPNIVYAGSYQGYITRFDKRTGQAQSIAPWPEVTDGSGAAGLKHRFTWTEPIVISPHDSNVLYHAAEVLFRSTNGGMSWTAVSRDLTRNDKSKQQVGGGPITKEDTGAEYYDVIYSVAASLLQKDLIWVGTDDGLVHLTRDAGQTWTDITPKQLPEWSMISLIEPSPHLPAAAYIAVDRHRLDDYRPYIYKTSDFGRTWTKITAGIPDNTYVHAVREDPAKRGLLYAGTETGVYFSLDDGARWQPLQLNLPATPIHDLVVKGDDLVVATHGRSFWILDDLSPLRQWGDATPNAGAHLYAPRIAYRTRAGHNTLRGRPYGENPPAGAVLYYALKAAPKENEEITMEILDAQGRLVRKLTSREKRDPEAPPEWP